MAAYEAQYLSYTDGAILINVQTDHITACKQINWKCQQYKAKIINNNKKQLNISKPE